MVCPVCFVTGDRNLVVLDDAVSFSEGSTPIQSSKVWFSLDHFDLLSICLSVYLSYLSMFLSFCHLFVDPFICLSAFLSI